VRRFSEATRDATREALGPRPLAAVRGAEQGSYGDDATQQRELRSKQLHCSLDVIIVIILNGIGLTGQPADNKESDKYTVLMATVEDVICQT
jgi:hypothetical protein